jgi:hypothetical protein
VYGVPSDLNLQNFVGSTLTQVAIGEFELQFHFQPEGHIQPGLHIGVGGRWELRDQSGHLVDEAQPTRDRDVYRVHQLLGRRVTGWEIDAPTSMTLAFDSGYRLQIFDSSREYESFTITPGWIIV